MSEENRSLALGQGSGAPMASAPVDLWDPENTRSVINIVPATLGSAMLMASRDHGELFVLDERDLKRKVSPTPTDNRLRLAFWMEYDRAQAQGGKMEMTRIYTGICTRAYFEEK